jgi:hypothetical protein
MVKAQDVYPQSVGNQAPKYPKAILQVIAKTYCFFNKRAGRDSDAESQHGDVLTSQWGKVPDSKLACFGASAEVQGPPPFDVTQIRAAIRIVKLFNMVSLPSGHIESMILGVASN